MAYIFLQYLNARYVLLEAVKCIIILVERRICNLKGKISTLNMKRQSKVYFGKIDCEGYEVMKHVLFIMCMR